MSVLRPLYCPPPLRLSEADLRRATQVHWSVLASECESRLKDFLAVPPGIGIMLLDRATHALEAAFLRTALRIRRGTYTETRVLIPRETYRAAQDAALQHPMGLSVALAEHPDLAGQVLTDQDIGVPTTLGGTKIQNVWLRYSNCVVDAAHTGYRHMFAGLSDWKGFCVLSFFPTKPLGAWGGGALVGPQGDIDEIRATVYPIDCDVSASFDYPAGVQSLGIMQRLCEWSPEPGYAHQLTVAALCRVLEPLGFLQRWGPLVTPHVLSFHHDDPGKMLVLRLLMTRLGYETGDHYAPLGKGWRNGENQITLPFIYPELPGELHDALAR